jgi:DnaK suppressor protein
MDAKHANKLLREERLRVERELAELRSETGADGELSNVDQHTADGGTELLEDERVQSMIARLEHELDAIERALKRVDEGTYGVSIESGEPIPDGRLEAVPHAERTVEEQARFEQQHRNSA